MRFDKSLVEELRNSARVPRFRQRFLGQILGEHVAEIRDPPKALAQSVVEVLPNSALFAFANLQNFRFQIFTIQVNF